MYFSAILFKNYWLSGSNLANRNEYSWVALGKRISFRNWANNQPGTAANRCVRTNTAFDFVADDCNALNYFICTKPVEVSCLNGKCDDGFHYEFE